MYHLENQRFGRLVAIERMPGKKWLCKCDCGNEKIIETYSLLSGATRSCGCFQNESRTIDISGQKFGRLIAIEATNKIKNNSIVWKFKCDCGKECDATVESVKWGGRKSCGCLQRETKEKQAIDMQKNCERIDGTYVNNILSDKLYSSNTSGHKGVHWHKHVGKWVARIQFQGKKYHLGSFSKIEDAITARMEAEQNLHEPFLEWYADYKKKQKDNN